MPTIIEFTILSPIWKLNDVPTRFIINIISAPTIEFITNFMTFFTGNEKYFPKIIIIAIHAINDNMILLSIFLIPFCFLTL